MLSTVDRWGTLNYIIATDAKQAMEAALLTRAVKSFWRKNVAIGIFGGTPEWTTLYAALEAKLERTVVRLSEFVREQEPHLGVLLAPDAPLHLHRHRLSHPQKFLPEHWKKREYMRSFARESRAYRENLGSVLWQAVLALNMKMAAAGVPSLLTRIVIERRLAEDLQHMLKTSMTSEAAEHIWTVDTLLNWFVGFAELYMANMAENLLRPAFQNDGPLPDASSANES